MKLLDYSWNTATSIAQRDYDSLRLILDDRLQNPVLAGDKRGVVIKLPTPREVEGGFYSLHGLYCDQDDNSWAMLWRLYKASLYHTSLHAAYSDFRSYAQWAKGKELAAATFAVSLVEDLHVTLQAVKRWPGILPDIAFANYISALRIRDPDSVGNTPLRVAMKMLLEVWGVNAVKSATSDEDKEVKSVAERMRGTVEDSVGKSKEGRATALIASVNEVYASVSRNGEPRAIPSFPYTETHGGSDLFDSKLVGGREGLDSLKISAFANLGLKPTEQTGISAEAEARDVHVDLTAESQRLAGIKATYDALIAPTRLEAVEFPSGDYGLYLRTRSSLAGPIRKIRDQLRLVKNVLGETSGHQGGQLETQAAIQVIASGVNRNDVFLRNEPTQKDEAWAILLDASKSISSLSRQFKGIGTCLAEVSKELIPNKNQWAMYSFNNSLQIIKDFSEDYGTASKARIGGLEQRSATLLPDAMSATYRALAAMPVEVRILVVVSDGYPVGYAGIEEKLVSTIQQISKSGVLLMGVGVDCREIEEYFAVNCVLSSPYEMMKSFVKSYLELSAMF